MAYITFIHGIANKPPKDIVRNNWIDALLAGNEGLDLPANGIDSQMVYWADVMYESPVSTDQSLESFGQEATTEEVEDAEADVDMSWLTDASEEEKAFIQGVASEVMPKAEAMEMKPVVKEERAPDGVVEEAVVLERIPLPWFVKEPLMKKLLRDVHHYLFNVEYSPRAGAKYRVRDEIRHRFVEALTSVPDSRRPHIVVSHSMGTVIAYDCLKRVADCPVVDAFITIGSPLGLDEVQDKLHPEGGGPGWTKRDGFPSEKVRGGWSNIYDRLDPVVGFDPQFANDYRRGGESVVEDLNEQNFGRWRHDISKYLGGRKLRSLFKRVLGL